MLDYYPMNKQYENMVYMNQKKPNIVNLDSRESFFIFPSFNNAGTMSHDHLWETKNTTIRQSIANKKSFLMDSKRNNIKYKSVSKEKYPCIVKNAIYNGTNGFSC